MPVLNDWPSAQVVLLRLDSAFAGRGDTLSVLLVDDGSTEMPPPDFAEGPYDALKTVEVLSLKKNLGHQRALAVGLCRITEKIPCDAVLVMDSDGEDEPADAARLAEKLSELNRETSLAPIIFAERTRRSETLVFRIGYGAYRLLHYLLTGRGIRFGNFSIIPQARLGAVTTEPMLWNHYAASVAGSRLPYTTIPSHRGQRIAGRSRLRFLSLIVHGLSALSCYNEIIGVRLLIVSSFFFVVTLLAIAGLLFLRLGTDLPIPGWTSVVAGLLIIFLVQVITLASNFTMQIISARSAQPFLPLRDYVWYVEGTRPYYNQSA
jgi:glycosyltransferase involved in cell wall biosynthesis